MNTIMVVVDRFTKYAVFVAAPTVCTAEVDYKAPTRESYKSASFKGKIIGFEITNLVENSCCKLWK